MASVLSVKETSSNILSSAETILTAVTEVRFFIFFVACNGLFHTL